MKPLSVTIQMKATEHYFPAVLFIMLYYVALNFESVDEVLKSKVPSSVLLSSTCRRCTLIQCTRWF